NGVEHKKVLLCYDGAMGRRVYVSGEFGENRTSGTYEFWILVINPSGVARFGLRNPLDQWTVYMLEDLGLFKYYNGGTETSTGITCTANKWYRFSVDFSDDGTYAGLPAHQYQFRIYDSDGRTLLYTSPNADFNNNGTSNDFNMNTGNDATEIVYFDAISYSWDPNYNIGDNIYEGLLLNFTSEIELDWIAYSPDNQSNRTISGNTTILMPNIGAHTIQVFGNDSIGTNYQSEKRNFTIGYPISIFTPKNKTYTELMTGYYPATYGFENDKVGAVPAGWTDTYTVANCFVKVIDEKDGHKKVVELDDQSLLGAAVLNKTFVSSQVLETVEFWYFPDTNSYSNIDLYSEEGLPFLSVQFVRDYDCIRYWDTLGPAEPFYNTYLERWYHMRFDIDYDNDIYDIYIDGVKFVDDGPFIYPADNCSTVRFATWIGVTGKVYIDAIGFSTDANYETGDNSLEGLLVSFENSTNLDWIGYSLDSQSNRTILGNTTLRMPNNGSHTLQVFGNDTFGDIDFSEKRHFIIDMPPISILSPENKTYTERMHGYYPATCGFENDEAGTVPSEVEDASYQSGTRITVIDEFAGHKKVLKFTDPNAQYQASMRKNFTQDQIVETVEFWIYPDTDSHSDITLHPRNGAVRFIYVQFMHLGNIIRYYDGNYYTLYSPYVEKWYHIQFDIDYDNDQYDIYIDGVLCKEDAGFANPADNSSYMCIDTWIAEAGEIYVDAIGFSWDANYEIGDNYQEGLLLSTDNYRNLDWVGYSLDGQSNKTLRGNITIPMPNDGPHTIQVFANDSFGINYETEVRHFFTALNPPPDPPVNLTIHQGIQHIVLNWTEPNDYGNPITRYNVYRGTIQNGSKVYIGNSTTLYYNDTQAIVNVTYYYIVRTLNVLGESANSTEVSGKARNASFVEWMTPSKNELIIFPPGLAVFHFTYDFTELDDVKLFLNGIDYGSVLGKTSINFTFTVSLDGHVNATLCGYNITDMIVSDSRNFTFVKLISDVVEQLDSGMNFVGQVLYLILHDPNGDNSFSGFAETTSLSMTVGSSFAASVGIELSASYDMFGYGVGASSRLQVGQTSERSAEYMVTDTTELTSSLDSSNKDYIGPGYGDCYWGEAITYSWVLKAHRREYFNGTIKYEAPRLDWGIIRGGEVLLNDYNAPQAWRAYNPVHNGWQNVDWDSGSPLSVDGGFKRSFIKETTTSEKRSISTTVVFDNTLQFYLGPVELSFSLNLEWQNHKAVESTTGFKTSFTIYDDESTDHISQQYGIDRRFSSIIFKPIQTVSRSSNPLEYNTTDYVPPLINFPEIELDSSTDGLAPCKDDSPIVTVDISDEGGIQSALIYYSINDGANWDSIILSEQLFNPGIWEGSIPGQEHGTTVLWYINVWDNEGNNATRKDPQGIDYRYTVLNRDPTITVISPNGGETFKDTIRIEWFASDLDSDNLTFTLAYNADGVGWCLIESNVTGTQYDWDISNIPYAKSVLIKVIANDGFDGETEDASDFLFTIGEPPRRAFPLLEITNIIMLVALGVIAANYLRKSSIFQKRTKEPQKIKESKTLPLPQKQAPSDLKNPNEDAN
ncbi:MAG: hypothetical protein HWN66_13515, partial [Candidatus Helarchaeota archaeon]|nr:hypothetical protein [Candidatus Helarchaeota archaeon]